MSYKNFYKILNDEFVDLFFVPKHDVYMVVKKSYTPDIDAIEKIKETGDSNIKIDDSGHVFYAGNLLITIYTLNPP